ncbi:SfiI family type II restriction endonuclease [Cyanobacteria bacterium FACHB-502]|nr:SfiI family type II restriction endonuclease [Cyanobacteria bacterium FACHB-502]MBD2026131.1 SfiI family type II restriction endonuclease [Leptolyngbya sp. FACHB-711]
MQFNINNSILEDTIWLAGRNAPTRNEVLRVYLSFND